MSNMIPLTGMDVIEFVPSAFKDKDGNPRPKAATFLIRVPTFAIKDKIAAILFQRGFMPAQLSVGRAILIDALYELYDEAEADEKAAFLESYWVKSEVHNELLQGWQMREAQRIFDIGMGVRKDLPQEPLPQTPFTMRDEARQAAIVVEVVSNSERYRSYQARFMVQQEEEEAMTVRVFLEGWKNCGAVKPERDDMDRLTEPCIEAVRQWLAEQAAVDAWDEVKAAVKNQFGAPGRTEKNSDSPLDTNSSQNGLLDSSGDLESSDGSSTTSSTTPTLPGRSPATSDASRNSRSGRKNSSKAARRKSGQTAAAS